VIYNRLVQTLSEIRQLLAERGLRPKHRLGQNFLHDKNQLLKLLDAAEVKPGDVVLEVGPGTGTLTSALLERGAEVIACEIDQDMAAIVADVFAEYIREPGSESPVSSERRTGTPRLAVIKGDALEKARRLNPQIVEAIGGRQFKLVANLPYQIASPLMTTLLIDCAPLDSRRRGNDGTATCTGQFITIQKEVADRLLAQPSTKEYGPLTIIVQAFAEVSKIGTLSPSCFWPPPEVTSAMVAIVPKDNLMSSEDRRAFAQFVTQLFTKRRKQLGAILGRDFVNWPEGVLPQQRPEALTVTQLLELWRTQRDQ
jgi:16S rRNA (adenine1518-N6/adenine1519-N6)-dimethyltransferase